MNYVPIVILGFVVVSMTLIGWVAKDGSCIYTEKNKEKSVSNNKGVK